MLTSQEMEELRFHANRMFGEAGIVLTEKEKSEVEIVDFNLNQFETIGLSLVVYENNEKYCAKEMVLMPWQICPEHRHPNCGAISGKQETFRVRRGEVYLYVEGNKTIEIKAKIPEDAYEYFTVFNEIILRPGEQYTLAPDTLHWFQAGEDGAIISEFSSPSDDKSDIFTDIRITRVTMVKD